MAILNKGTLGSSTIGGNPGNHGYTDYNKAKGVAGLIANASGLTASKNATVKSIVDSQKKPTTTVTNTDTGGGSSGGGGGTSDDIVNMIKNLLNEQKQKADEYYKTLYEQQISQIGQQDEANRNQANLNYMRGNRYLNSLYGNGISGQGLSNRVRNNSNWQNNLASIRQNTANNKASALAQYNSGLANNASTLAQGWYNYVLPVYTNRQQWLDNLAYRNM